MKHFGNIFAPHRGTWKEHFNPTAVEVKKSLRVVLKCLISMMYCKGFHP